MNKYVLSCCSTSDLSQEHYEKRDLKCICFHFQLGDKEYSDDFGQSVSFEEFYKKMSEGVMTKTSQVNTDEFVNYFTPFLEEGNDIIHLCLSSNLSGVYNSANIAKEMLMEQFPDRRITIIDSLAASSGLGLFMDTLADLRDEGKTYDEVVEFANAQKLYLHHWFFSTDLTYYVRGGRISKTSGVIGSILHICPLLNMNDEGKLTPRRKIIGKRRVIKEIVEEMQQHAQNGLEYDGKCYICHSACLDDAKTVVALIEEKFPKLQGKVEIYNIGTTIGSHTGPGTIALFFFGDKRIR